MELVDGVKVKNGEAWVALPDPVRPLMHIYSEPGDGARGLVQEYRAVVERTIAGSLMEQAAAAADKREEVH